jgi:protein-tyrosine phosphatase
MTASSTGTGATSPAPPSRHLELEGASNFRDLGGYVGAGGRTVRWRMVFRSDGLDRLSAGDRRVLLDELGLVAVIDLRSSGEGRKLGRFSVEGTGVRLHHVPILDETRRLVEEADTAFTMAGLYTRMLDGASDRFVAALRLVAGAEGPVVFHCAAGKDRTGLLAALLLGLLGAGDADILADYGHSERSLPRLRRRWERRLEADRAAGRSRFVSAEEWQRVGDELLSANPETMAAALAHLRAQHGGLPGWALAHGFAEEELVALQARLLVPAANSTNPATGREG